MKKLGFLFFDLLFAFAISTVLMTIIFICTTFFTTRFRYLQEYEQAKNVLYQTMQRLECGDFFLQKEEIKEQLLFTISNQKIPVKHSLFLENNSQIPCIKTTISWQSYDDQQKSIMLQRFYIRDNHASS